MKLGGVGDGSGARGVGEGMARMKIHCIHI